MEAKSFRRLAGEQHLLKRGYAEIRKARALAEKRSLTWTPSETDPAKSVLQAKQLGLLPDVLLHRVLKSASESEQFEVYKLWGEGANPWILLSRGVLRSHLQNRSIAKQ